MTAAQWRQPTRANGDARARITGDRMSPVLRARFWAKVDRSGECWLWTGWLHPSGYGQVDIDHVAHRAHRLSFEMENGPIPAGMLACHHCDTPACVRPSHLFLGTSQENSADRHTKGRTPSGELAANAKLSAAEVQSIRARLASGEAQRAVARAFGISRFAVRSIAAGLTWKQLPPLSHAIEHPPGCMCVPCVDGRRVAT